MLNLLFSAFPFWSQRLVALCLRNSRSRRRVVLLIPLIISLASVILVINIISSNRAPVNAGTIDRVLNVDTGLWYPTIQSAISISSTTDGHTLSVTVGTYNENIVITKSLTIIGEDTISTVIDGGGVGRVISVSTRATVNISNVTIQNGDVFGNGGGIYNQGVLILANSHVISNTSGTGLSGIPGGGGIYNEGELSVISSTISNNRSSSMFSNIGVGIANSGVLTVTNSTISDNTEPSSANVGGSIYNIGVAFVISTALDDNQCAGIWNHTGGTLSLTDSSVNYNKGEYVGGIRNSGTLTVTRSTVEGNSTALVGAMTSGDAGGILNYNMLTVISSTISNNSTCKRGGGIYNGGTLVMSNSTVYGNDHRCSSSSGGGIFSNGILTVANSTFSRNTSEFGGGLFVDSGTASLNGVTVAYNTSAGSGGGVSQAGGTIQVQNTIVARNDGGQSPDCSGTVISLGYNLLGNNSDCIFAPTSGDIVGTNSNPANPSLGPLGNFGGPNLTIGLISGSLAIDAGNPATCQPMDQRGFPRQDTCDIGAYEFGVGPGVVLSYLPVVLR